MKTSNAGIELIKSFEGCRLTAYTDPIGVWTIGYGHIKDVRPGQTITPEQADSFLRSDLASAEKAVSAYEGLYHWSQGQFDGLVSFTFNCGTGNFRKLIDNGRRSIPQISEKILAYNKAGGKVLPGLTRRRQAEKAMFDGGTTNTSKPILKMGSKGASVKELQALLNTKGYNLSVDGIYGEKTKEAITDYQAKSGLVPDGIAGRKTWQSLL